MTKFTFKLWFFVLVILTNIVSINTQAAANTSTSNTPTKKPEKSTSILQAIMSIFKPAESRFISRGNEVCLISPGNLGGNIIWSDRPLFIWQGEILESTINLSSSASNNDQPQDLDWTASVPDNTLMIAYTGDKLLPGVTYYWELISNGKTYSQTITVMEKPQREKIAVELMAVANQLKAKNASIEDIAIAKADYFIQQKLGSDALQQLYAVKNPSSNLTAQINDIQEHLCK